MTKFRWMLSGILLGGLLWWGRTETRAESGMGISPNPVLSVVCAADLGSPQVTLLVDTSQRKLAAYTTDKQGRIVFGALRPYLYDLAVRDELTLGSNDPPPTWHQMQQAAAQAYKADLEGYRKKKPGATIEDLLKDSLKDSAGQTQVMAEGSAMPGQSAPIQVLDLANQRILMYRFSFQAGLELTGVREISGDLAQVERIGKPEYVPVRKAKR